MFLNGLKTADVVENLIVKDKQIQEHCLDLTVKAVYKKTGAMQLDFGGSEYVPAEKYLIKPHKTKDEDEYGWWDLGTGAYLFEYNETLHILDNQKAVIQMHKRLIYASIVHPTIVFEKSGAIIIPMYVFHNICVKQNARVSELRIWQG